MISSSGNLKSSLGPTLAALKTTAEMWPMVSTSSRTFSNAGVFLISVAKVLIVTSFPAAFAAAKTLSRSLDNRVASRDIKAMFENLRVAKREAAETPIMGPEPMRTRVWVEAIALVEGLRYGLKEALKAD